MTARKRSIPRVEFRRALADWGMGRVHGDEVVALARAMPIRWGGRWRLLRETDIRPFRELGYETAALAYRWHDGEFDWVAAKLNLGDVGKARPRVVLSMRNTYANGLHVRSRTFARVASWLDIMALRIQALNVDHELRELLKPGRMVGCSPFDPRTVADRPWPCSVLLADPTGGIWFRGECGDCVEAWLHALRKRDVVHAMELVEELALRGLTRERCDTAPIDALERAGWIKRCNFEPFKEHKLRGYGSGPITYGTRSGGSVWGSLSRDYQSPTGDPCPSAFTFRLLEPAKAWLAERSAVAA